MEILNRIRKKIKYYYIKKKLEKRYIFLKDNVKLKKSEIEGRNTVGNDVNIEKTVVGFGTYIGNYSELPECKIGKYCSIGMRVKAIIGEHPIHYVSTHPFSYSNIKKKVKFDYSDRVNWDYSKKAFERFNIVIGNDVWLGDDVKILNGVKIGDGAVVAAGALVTKDVEPYSVMVGIPAKKIKDRFEKEEIEKLLKIKWWDRDEKWIEKNVALFSDVKEFIKRVENERE